MPPEYEASVATLESVAATLNAKCVLLREKQLDESGTVIRGFSDTL